MSKYTAYLDYKSSGAEWLGNIPEDWIAIPLKRLASFTTGMTPPTTITKYYSSDRTEFGWIRPEDIRETSEFVSSSKFLTKLGWKTQRVVLAKSSLICCIGTIGKTGYLLKSATTNQQITAATFKFSPKYYFYVLLAARNELEQMATGNVVQILNSERLSRLQVPLPTIYEAENIANFLDHETAKIDTLIGKQQLLIKLLKEKRQAVISHAVTKGINPNTPMKNSGVEWLGEVPAHWIASTLKHYSEVIDCKHITAEFFDDGIPLASISEVKKWFVDLSTAKYTSEKYYNELIGGGREPKVGDIIYSRNATVGEAAIVSEGLPPFAMGQDVCLIRLSNGLLPLFAMYVLHSSVISQQLELAMVGSTFKRINVDNIRNFAFVIPPLSEQDLIVSELEALTSKYDVLINNATNAIELMKERRTALISAAVTGKIDVRNWEQPND